ncbi:MAG: SGNH/GDSL hydrolase family protein [Verrucomicrobiales bacterium]
MKSRRSFLQKTTFTAGAAFLATQTNAQSENPSGVGGYNYRLPQFATGSRLLFQGDSITDMKWGRNEKDRNHYLGHSYVYLIASRLGVDMPEAKLDVFNRGISGNKVGDLRARWQKDAIDMKPDLLSILIGVNDIGKSLDGVDLKKWEEDYRFILDASRKANPELRLVLLDPFVVASGKLADAAAYKKWRGQVDRLLPIVDQLAKDYDAVHVKTQELFDAASKAVSPEQWIWDGVHPLPQGHEIIARNWIEAVRTRWS